MNISLISSTSTSSYSSGSDNDTKQLLSQIKNLQKQITTENQSKDDAKTKQVKVQLLQAQIAQIEAQVQQIQARKSNQNGNSEQITKATSIISSNNKIDVQA